MDEESNSHAKFDIVDDIFPASIGVNLVIILMLADNFISCVSSFKRKAGFRSRAPIQF